MPLLRLTTAENLALNIPAHSVQSIQSVRTANPNFPDAKSLIRYNIGQGLIRTLLLDAPADVVRQVKADEKGRKDWLAFNMGAETPIYLLPNQITAVTGRNPELEAKRLADEVAAQGDPAAKAKAEERQAEARSALADGLVTRIHFNVPPESLWVDVVETPDDVMQVLEPMGADGATPKSMQSRQ